MNPASPASLPLDAPRATACPGLARIVAARDGGICRVKLPCGALGADQALALAGAAERHASGVIEVTNRANLQLRGVRAGHESALTGALLDAGFGPAGGRAGEPRSGAPGGLAADDVRNVMVSPTAGRDPQALLDTTALAHEILARLRDDTRLHALSAKFALLLDGGERLAMLDHPHDVWLAAMPGPHGGAPRVAFGLAGCPPAAAGGEARSAPLAAVASRHAGALAAALLHAFLDLAEPGVTRMRDLLAVRPAGDVMGRAAARLDIPLASEASVAAWRRPGADPSLRLGIHPQREPALSHVGGHPPLGRLDAARLRGLATLAAELGAATMHMTPWQSVLLPDVPSTDAPRVLAGLAALGLACRPEDPLARVVACAGSAGCAKGLADTKADALRLAKRLPAGAEAHLSGCPRSCAAAHCAPHTLLAVAPGHYDLYRRDGQPGFGRCIARHLTIDEAAVHLERPAGRPTDA